MALSLDEPQWEAEEVAEEKLETVLLLLLLEAADSDTVSVSLVEDEEEAQGLAAPLALPLALADAHKDTTAVPLEMGQGEGDKELEEQGDRVLEVLEDAWVEGDMMDEKLAQALGVVEGDAETHIVTVAL